MSTRPDREYSAAQVFAAREVVTHIQKELVVLQEAEFFVDVDTLRDVIDPQGATACLYCILGQKVPDDLMEDPNVVGLIDEFELMNTKPQTLLAVKTLFQNDSFRNILRNVIEKLQSEFGNTAGDTPNLLRQYFNGEVEIHL